MTNNKLCKFRLVVYVDASSFGILVHCGNKCHNGHPKIQSKCMQLPKRLLSAHEKKQLKNSIDDDLLSSHVRNSLFNKTGVVLSRGSISYIRGLETDRISDVPKSLSEKVIEYLNEEGHDFISLCHRDVLSQQKKIQVETFHLLKVTMPVPCTVH